MSSKERFTKCITGRTMPQVYQKYSKWIYDMGISQDDIEECELTEHKFGYVLRIVALQQVE